MISVGFHIKDFSWRNGKSIGGAVYVQVEQVNHFSCKRVIPITRIVLELAYYKLLGIINNRLEKSTLYHCMNFRQHLSHNSSRTRHALIPIMS